MTSVSVNSSSGSETKSSKPILSIPPISNQVFKLSNKVYIGDLSDSKKSTILDCAEGYWEFHKSEKTSKCYCCHYLGKKMLRRVDPETERPHLRYLHRFNGEDIKNIQSRDGTIGIFDEAVMSNYLKLCHPENNPLYTDMKNQTTISSLYEEGVSLHLPSNKTWTVHVIYNENNVINCIQISESDFYFHGEYHDVLGIKSLKSTVEALSKETSWDAERAAEIQKIDNGLDKTKLEQMQKTRESLKVLNYEDFNIICIPENKSSFVVRGRTVLGVVGMDPCHLKPIDEHPSDSSGIDKSIPEQTVDILRTKYGYLYYFTEEGCDLFHTDEEKLNNVSSPPALTILPSPFSDSFMPHETSFRNEVSLPVITSTRAEVKTVTPGLYLDKSESKKPVDIIDLMVVGQGEYKTIDNPKYNRCVVTINEPVRCIGQLRDDHNHLGPYFYNHLNPLTPQMAAELENIYGIQYSYNNTM